MKKIAIILAVMLVACLAFAGCSNDKNPDNSTSSVQTPASSQAPEQSSATTTNPPAPAGELYKFAGDVASLKDKDEINATYGQFTIVGCNAYVKGSGKGATDGTRFDPADGVQIGKKGSFTAKCIKFHAAANTTLVVYANRGSSSVDSGNLILGNASGTVETKVVGPDVEAVSFTITAEGDYALWTDDVSSINVFGIKL